MQDLERDLSALEAKNRKAHNKITLKKGNVFVQEDYLTMKREQK
jgi:hypothetical protein